MASSLLGRLRRGLATLKSYCRPGCPCSRDARIGEIPIIAQAPVPQCEKETWDLALEAREAMNTGTDSTLGTPAASLSLDS